MYCGNCGNQLKEGAKFCPNCGARVESGGGFKNTAQDALRQTERDLDSSFREVQGTWQNVTNPGGRQSGREYLRDDRSLVSYILLNIITCGIYGFYFVYKIAHDVNIACADDGNETPGLAAYILLSFITCGFYNLYWYYKIANRLAANAPQYGLNFTENGTTVLVWYLVGMLICGIGQYVAMHILIKNSNALFRAYNQRWGLRNSNT